MVGKTLYDGGPPNPELFAGWWLVEFGRKAPEFVKPGTDVDEILRTGYILKHNM